jgi:hypothetical protein
MNAKLRGADVFLEVILIIFPHFYNDGISSNLNHTPLSNLSLSMYRCVVPSAE